MTTAEAKTMIGQYGLIHANGDNYPKWLYGRIAEVDRTCLEFIDNHEFIHIFKVSKVISFELKEFTDKSE